MLPTVVCFAVLLAPGADAKNYAKPELLIELPDLVKQAKTFRVLDARPRDKYEAGHIPGAVWVDHDAWSKSFDNGKDADGWAKRVGALGSEVTTPIVLYDDNLSKDAARIWWILRFWGVRDVRLLNGGWKGWVAVDGPMEKTASQPKLVTPKLSALSDRLATKKQIMDVLKDKPPQLVDSRSTGEFCGTEETAKRNGSMPGAVHLEWSDTLDKKTGRFKSADELTKLFKEAGIDPTKPAVTYCQSGGRAAVLAFTLELMGAKEVSNYYRSWAEWGNDPDTPIEKPKN